MKSKMVFELNDLEVMNSVKINKCIVSFELEMSDETAAKMSDVQGKIVEIVSSLVVKMNTPAV